MSNDAHYEIANRVAGHFLRASVRSQEPSGVLQREEQVGSSQQASEFLGIDLPPHDALLYCEITKQET
jgi:hypothetical protein